MKYMLLNHHISTAIFIIGAMVFVEFQFLPYLGRKGMNDEDMWSVTTYKYW